MFGDLGWPCQGVFFCWLGIDVNLGVCAGLDCYMGFDESDVVPLHSIVQCCEMLIRCNPKPVDFMPHVYITLIYMQKDKRRNCRE